MILFLLNPQYVNIVDFLKKEDFTYSKLLGEYDLHDFFIHNMRSFEHYSNIVINRSSCINNDDDFINCIEQILIMYDIKISVFDEKMDSDFVEKLIDIGIYNIITANEKQEFEQQLIECLSEDGMQRYKCNNKPLQPQYDFKCVNKRIGVFGTINRIGTTTTALTLALWLSSIGASVCYYTKQNFKEIELECSNVEGGLNNIRFTNNQMVQDENYNYIIEDNGTDITRISEVDSAILCAGFKFGEVRNYIALKSIIDKYAITIIPTFCTQEQIEKIQKYFNDNGKNNIKLIEKQHDVIFANYMPSYSDIVADGRYDEIVKNDFVSNSIQ